MSADPLQTVHAALEQKGCDPQGPVHKFTAKCPAHDDRSPSLSVREGADRRTLLYCHAGCETDAIVTALGLSWADLFPPGQRNARARRGITSPPRSAIDLALARLNELRITWRCSNTTRDQVTELW